MATDLVMFTVVLVAVLENQPHVGDELPRTPVRIEVELLLHRAQVHGLGDDVEVVQDAELDRVDGLVEPVGALELVALVQDLSGGLLPGLL